VVERWIEEMILILAGQSQWLSHMCTPKISDVFNGIRTHDHYRCRCSAPTNWAVKPLTCEEVNLLGSFVPCSHLSGFIVQLERHKSAASSSQRSQIPISLKTPEIFNVHILLWDNPKYYTAYPVLYMTQGNCADLSCRKACNYCNVSFIDICEYFEWATRV